MILPCMVRMPIDFDIPTWQRTKEELLPIPIRRGFDKQGYICWAKQLCMFALSQLVGASRLGNLLLRIQPSERPVIFRGLLIFFFLCSISFYSPSVLGKCYDFGSAKQYKTDDFFCLLFSSDLNHPLLLQHASFLPISYVTEIVKGSMRIIVMLDVELFIHGTIGIFLFPFVQCCL